MATLSITIPDNQVSRVNDAIAALYNYQATINGSPNPETKAQFSRRMIIENLKRLVAQGESTVARKLADSQITLS
jgi:hypothetical protein